MKSTAAGPSCIRCRKLNYSTMTSSLLTWSWEKLLVSQKAVNHFIFSDFFMSPVCGSIVFPHSFFFPADVVLSAFRNLSQEHPNATVPPGKLQEFLSLYFEAPGTEFESWTPPDWHDKWDPVIRGLVSLLWSFYCAWLTRLDFYFQAKVPWRNSRPGTT